MDFRADVSSPIVVFHFDSSNDVMRLRCNMGSSSIWILCAIAKDPELSVKSFEYLLQELNTKRPYTDKGEIETSSAMVRVVRACAPSHIQ